MSKLTTITLPSGSTYDLGEGEANQNAFSMVTYQNQSVNLVKVSATSEEDELVISAGDNMTFEDQTWTNPQGETRHTLQMHASGSADKVKFLGGWKATDTVYTNKLVFQVSHDTVMPSTTSSGSGSSKTINTRAFNPFGLIMVYKGSSSVSANGTIDGSKLFTKENIDIRYSFNMASDLTTGRAVYLKCTPVEGSRLCTFVTGTGTLSQSLPNSSDTNYYIYLGQAYSSSGASVTAMVQLALEHPVYANRGGMVRQVSQFSEYATMAGADGSGNDIASTYIANKGTFSGSIDSTSIAAGIYELSAFAVTIGGVSKSLYGTFTQYADTYKTQVINAGIAGESRVYTRRYLTGSSSWTAWSDYTPYGTIQTFSPTFASPAGVTINRSHFMRLGPMVWVHIVMTLSSALSSQTNIYTGIPAADAVTDIPAIGYTNGDLRTLLVNSAGKLYAGGAMPAGSYAINGWYYSTS